jgi:zinc finger HIT domain-containing protein 1
MNSTNISRDNAGKRGQRGKLDIAKVFYQDFYDNPEDPTGHMNFHNYLSVAAKPSKFPTRFFCSVCGYNSKYQCTRCGLRYCSMRCGETHKETRCIKFAE